MVGFRGSFPLSNAVRAVLGARIHLSHSVIGQKVWDFVIRLEKRLQAHILPFKFTTAQNSRVPLSQHINSDGRTLDRKFDVDRKCYLCLYFGAEWRMVPSRRKRRRARANHHAPGQPFGFGGLKRRRRPWLSMPRDTACTRSDRSIFSFSFLMGEKLRRP